MSIKSEPFPEEASAVVTKDPPKPAKVALPVNLSSQIAEAVERQPGDRVKCTYISGNNYRVNWWAPTGTEKYDNPSMEGLLVTTHRVRQSRFLSVQTTPAGLVMTTTRGGMG
jgi:hypothetical protein